MNDPSPVRGAHLSRGNVRQALAARIFRPLLDRIDQRLVSGAIDVQLPDGTRRLIGAPDARAPISFTLKRWRALLRMVRSGSIGLYRGWAAGEWACDDLVGLFALLSRNRQSLSTTFRGQALPRAWQRLRHLANRNNRPGARRNITAHYDLGNDFYAAWLDPSMSYSSALFAPGDDLERAQMRKVDAALDRIGAGPDTTMLEIGCGWGALAGRAAARGAAVTAISLSPSQLQWARQHHAGPDFRQIDYRDVTGTFDGVVSIEMVEAVGQEYWGAYLDAIAQALKPGGRAAIQYIAIADDMADAYAHGVDFIQRYIFPGGSLLAQPRFRALAAARGLRWHDEEHFPLDYAQTLAQWRARFDAAVLGGRLPKGFDKRFVDLWRFYLMYCEGGFRGGGITVAQVTLTKDGTKEG